jgi:protocatechuate 3,4-dioxygenase beta subunit
MNKNQETRRDFIRNAVITAASLPILVNCKGSSFAVEAKPDILELIKKNAKPAGTEAMGAIEAPADVTWKTAFEVGKDDGEPMIISGTVYKPDGKTAAPNTLIYFYHTDKYGIYGRQGQHKHGRFRGWMLTDVQGRYEFSSVRPASYPNSTQSQHVHMTVTGVNYREDWIDSILFEGDRFLTQRERDLSGKRGGFDPIITLARGSDGIPRAVRDIQLMAG